MESSKKSKHKKIQLEYKKKANMYDNIGKYMLSITITRLTPKVLTLVFVL